MSLLKRELGEPLSMDCSKLKMYSKIENFIRTKYESKRWVMEGPIPDPSTLDTEGDDDVVGLDYIFHSSSLIKVNKLMLGISH